MRFSKSWLTTALATSEGDHAHQRAGAHDRHVAGAALEHHATHFVHPVPGVQVSGVIIPSRHAPSSPMEPPQHDRLMTSRREHADQVAVLHDHQRADVMLGHHGHGFGQRLVQGDGERCVSLDTQRCR